LAKERLLHYIIRKTAYYPDSGCFCQYRIRRVWATADSSKRCPMLPLGQQQKIAGHDFLRVFNA